MSETTLLEALSADFPKDQVRQRDGGRGIKLDYIDVVQTIHRLTDVLKADWDWRVLDASCELVETANGPTYLASERGELHVWLPNRERPVVRGGSGADTDPRDPDKAIKTADAEALKKAGHKFGIALYLWDEAKRDEIAEFRKLSTATVQQLKKAALVKAGAETGDELLADVNNVLDTEFKIADLSDRGVLLDYLAA